MDFRTKKPYHTRAAKKVDTPPSGATPIPNSPQTRPTHHSKPSYPPHHGGDLTDPRSHRTKKLRKHPNILRGSTYNKNRQTGTGVSVAGYNTQHLLGIIPNLGYYTQLRSLYPTSFIPNHWVFYLLSGYYTQPENYNTQQWYIIPNQQNWVLYPPSKHYTQ